MKFNFFVKCVFLFSTVGVFGAAGCEDKNNQLSGNQANGVINESQQNVVQYCEVLGWMSCVQNGIKDLNLVNEEVDAYLKGVKEAIQGETLKYKVGDLMDKMQEYFKQRTAQNEKINQEKIKKDAALNRQLASDFLKNAMLKDKDIQLRQSGLAYKIEKKGGEIFAKDEDFVEIFYTGKLIDGSIFDQAVNDTVRFPLNGVISGLKEGLQIIGEGGKLTLYIPDNLAYGEQDIPGVPVGSMLIFDVELKKVVKPAEQNIKK